MVVANPAFEIKIEQQEDNDDDDNESNGGVDVDTPLQNALNTDLFADSSERTSQLICFTVQKRVNPTTHPTNASKKERKLRF
ncbi:hypothetical protein LSTR_LSTR015435 [Laodelphax striatellus]|uniref:Uncharacterized protein n=1 Tax=Laodelphax striatellus TaxID=195883 RepID=A0A482WPD7_LAOST|nr:hypothetical protein LSTR_LSTR015435 [Laodelphax striatellus]